MKLDRIQQKQFRKALVDAFPELKDLKKLTLDQLGEKLPTIVATHEDTTTIVFELTQWAERHGRLGELVAGARAENPSNPELLAFLEAAGLTATKGIPKASLEKIVSQNSAFLDVVRWREALEVREYQVGRVEVGNKPMGTAFLVGPDLVMTNHHVIQSIYGGAALSWGVRFNYKVGADGVAVDAGMLVQFAKDWHVDSSPYSPLDCQTLVERQNAEPGVDFLDYALVRLVRPISEEPRRGTADSPPRGHIRILTTAPEWAQVRGLAILQHPSGSPLKLALGLPAELTPNAPGSRVRHTTPTEPGSSGSPVFDTDWNLIALHHSGDPNDFKPTYNEAIPIHLIAARPEVKAALGL